MSQVGLPRKSKLLVGFFLNNKDLSRLIIKDLESMFGPIDMISRWIIFNHTMYYRKEMSYPLYRRFIVFKSLIDQCSLARIKLLTNSLEKKYVHSNGRLVNIDPGYILAERFVLATGKNYAHRIYIGSGIYADLTLIYNGGEFKELPWTYPDYTEFCVKNFLTLARNKYLLDIRK